MHHAEWSTRHKLFKSNWTTLDKYFSTWFHTSVAVVSGRKGQRPQNNQLFNCEQTSLINNNVSSLNRESMLVVVGLQTHCANILFHHPGLASSSSPQAHIAFLVCVTLFNQSVLMTHILHFIIIVCCCTTFPDSFKQLSDLYVFYIIYSLTQCRKVWLGEPMKRCLLELTMFFIYDN